MSFNKIIIHGNLGKDPELRYTGQGTAICNFSVATSEKVKKEEKWESVTTWFKCTVWGKVAENCAKYLSKGSPVFLDGVLREDEWTDKEGNRRTTLLVNVKDVQFMERKDSSDSVSTSDEDSTENAVSATASPADDDIPF